MLVPVLHKTLSTLAIASALSSNVLLAALPTTSASAAGIIAQPTHSAAASPTSPYADVSSFFGPEDEWIALQFKVKGFRLR